MRRGCFGTFGREILARFVVEAVAPLHIGSLSISFRENASVRLHTRASVRYVYIAARTRHIRLIFHTRFYTRSNYNNNKLPRLVPRSRDRPVPTYSPWTPLVLWNWFNIFISLCKSTTRRAASRLTAVSPLRLFHIFFHISSLFIDFTFLDFILWSQSGVIYSI